MHRQEVLAGRIQRLFTRRHQRTVLTAASVRAQDVRQSDSTWRLHRAVCTGPCDPLYKAWCKSRRDSSSAAARQVNESAGLPAGLPAGACRVSACRVSGLLLSGTVLLALLGSGRRGGGRGVGLLLSRCICSCDLLLLVPHPRLLVLYEVVQRHDGARHR